MGRRNGFEAGQRSEQEPEGRVTEKGEFKRRKCLKNHGTAMGEEDLEASGGDW